MSATTALEIIRQARGEIARLTGTIRRETYAVNYVWSGIQNVAVYTASAVKALEALEREVTAAGSITDWSPAATAKRVSVLDPWVTDGAAGLVTPDVKSKADRQGLARVLTRSQQNARSAVSWLERVRDAAALAAREAPVPPNPPQAPGAGSPGAPGNPGDPGGNPEAPPVGGGGGMMPVILLAGVAGLVVLSQSKGG